MTLSAHTESIVLSAPPAESVILSALPARKHALRVSGRACPDTESIILSAGGAESMILSAPALKV